jgi:hypothetical protein
MSNHHLDAEILSVNAKLAECDALFSACPNEGGDRASALYDRHWSLRKRINRRRAKTVDGLKAKAVAAGFALKWDSGLTDEDKGSFLELCKSINRDIAALAET